MYSMFNLKSAAFLIGWLFVGAVGSAQAQSATDEQGYLDDKWVINLGSYVESGVVKARLNGETRRGEEIDFADTFGEKGKQARSRADILWRATPAHHVRFMYFDSSFNRSAVLGKDLQWGDYTFKQGASVEFDRTFEVYELAYEYAFLRDPTYEVAGSLGVHYMDLGMQLSGQGQLYNGAGASTNVGFVTRTSSVPAPLPVAGLRGSWLVAPDWLLEAQGQVFQMESGAFSGTWSDIRLSATWMFLRNFGIGLGYNEFSTRVDVSKNNFDGRLKLGYSGYQVFLTASF